MGFEKRKAAALAAMASTESDKSPKGSIDTPIIPLLSTLNSHPSFFTTSSCSGRISILSQPVTPSNTVAKSKKAKGGSWLFITHDPAEPNSVITLLFPVESTQPSTSHSELVFRFEPLIISVECRDVGSAQFLVSAAISCGFRESGITGAGKRVIVAIRCSIRLEVPLGDTDRLMVSEEYVRYLVEIANEKMEANWRRTEGFLRALRCNGFTGPAELGDKVLVNAAVDDDNGSACNEVHGTNGTEDQQSPLQRVEDDTHLGPSRSSGCSLSIVRMEIVGEPLEKLFLWGHSACNLGNPNDRRILVFGGFGGMGRHARRNESILLDPMHGALKAIETSGPLSPRLGHTSSLVGHFVYVIGGRADPTKILNEVWILNTTVNEWKLLKCIGCFFPPRHRHAAAVMNSKIYVFGGLNDDLVCSSLHVLDTDSLQWNEIRIPGEWPSARHSHALVAYGSQLFMFGGHNGEKPLADLYSFDIQTCLWKREMMAGKAPYARFSHSMFVYRHYLGIIGGCPVKQNCQELALLDMRLRLWKHIILNTVGKELFVRSTANVVGDDLVVVGGGASCYAFGTTFSKPVKVNLLPLISSDDMLMPSESGSENVVSYTEHPQAAVALCLAEGDNLSTKSEFPGLVASDWVLKIERNCAKFVKDILKKFGWLDLGRKVYSLGDGKHICFPVTKKFCALSLENQNNLGDGLELNVHLLKPYTGEGVSVDKLSPLTALNILKSCGASKIPDDVVEARRAPKSTLTLMHEAVSSLIKSKGLPEHLLEQLPTRWDRLGDVVVLPVTSFKDPVWDSIGEELWFIVAKSVNTRRLARQGRVAPNGTRDSSLEILVGDDGWVDHRENGIFYSFDATKCMFSWGNLSEKLRMSCLDCRDEVIIDLFA